MLERFNFAFNRALRMSAVLHRNDGSSFQVSFNAETSTRSSPVLADVMTVSPSVSTSLQLKLQLGPKVRQENPLAVILPPHLPNPSILRSHTPVESVLHDVLPPRSRSLRDLLHACRGSDGSQCQHSSKVLTLLNRIT